jgi:cytochrome c-type biogenesis protein CcsB
MLAYWIETGFSLSLRWPFGKLLMCVANLFLVSFLVTRWIESGHFPLSNLYESLIFLAWTLSSFHIWIEFYSNKKTNLGPNSFLETLFGSNLNQPNFIGCITSPSILLIQAFATLSLPKNMQLPSALVPALQSNWLMMHVTLMILSYAALIFGCLFSLAFLVLTRGKEIPLQGNSLGKTSFQSPSQEESGTLAISTLDNVLTLTEQSKSSTSLVTNNNWSMEQLRYAKLFDNLSYRILGIGFPLLTIGILSGAVWANEAWGSYWSWDPKETWAFLTWLIFAIYLHTRLTRGWSGKGPALIALLGLFSVWICFLGVNLLGEGLHSYGWISTKN